jgi:hypothetical protein
MSSPSLDEIHVTVCAVGVGEEFHLRREVELVKSALLYADRVTLASPKVALIDTLAETAPGTAEDAETFRASGLAETPGWQAALYHHDRQLDGAKLEAHEQALVDRFADQLKWVRDRRRARAEAVYAETGADELLLAAKQGLLTIDVLGENERPSTDHFRHVLDRLEELLEDVVSPTSETYPLFDDATGAVLQRMMEGDALIDPDWTHARHAGLASELVLDLEAFPHASMDVILDVRGQLQKPLRRFRSAVAEFARQLEEVPVDKAFRNEVRGLYVRLVEPELLDLRESIESLYLRPTLLRGAAPATGTTIALGIGAAFGVPDLALVGTLAAGFGGSAAAEVKHEIDEARARRRNRCFWLYKADRLMRRAAP